MIVSYSIKEFVFTWATRCIIWPLCIYKGVGTVGAEGAEAPPVFSLHSFGTYAQVVAYGSDTVRDPVKAAETLPPHFDLCLRP